MKRASSGASGGRPTRRDFHAQNREKPRRCHAITVAGRTIASASDHRDHRRQTTTGKMLSSIVLRKPFATIMSDMGLRRKLTSKAMRRTYQDLADEVQMRGAAAMAVSGHKTMAMKLHYSTAYDGEVRAGVGKVIQLATARRQAAGGEKS